MNTECLKEVLGNDEADELLTIMNGMSGMGQIELLKLIAAGMSQVAGSPENQSNLAYVGSDNVSVTESGNTTLPTIPATAKSASITAYGNDVIFTLDGTNPDYGTFNGHFLPMESTININSNLGALIFNSISATGADLYVTYFS